MFEIYGPPLKYFIPPTIIIIDIICMHLKGGPNISAEIIDPPIYIISLACYENTGPLIIILPGPSPGTMFEIIMDPKGSPDIQLK